VTHPYLADDQPLAFAHRGAHGVATGAGENSYEAFAAAVDLGYRYLETDVHCTADGVVVALHDDTLDRTTDGEGLVVQRAWGEIQRLTVEGGGRVPRLDELLADFPEARFNLDCKEPDTVPELVRVLREADALHRVCVGAFQHRTVASLRDEFGDDLCTAATSREVRLLVAAAAAPRGSRRALTFAINADCVQVPLRDGRTVIVTDRFIQTCHDAGLPVHVWTVDDAGAMEDLLDMGVDGLMTDQAMTLQEVLSSRARTGTQ
jgi:glycerophosphoryl diester phosphodiesterase